MTLENSNRASGAAIGLIIASVLFAFVTVAIKLALPVPAIDADRAAERTKALNEMYAAEEKSLDGAGWIDQSRGLVRLPIETAMQVAAKQWENPAAARAELNARQEKAVAELPKAPEKPGAFE